MADVKDRVGDVVSQAKRRAGLESPSAADDDGRVGIVRGALRAFGEGDIDGFLDALRDDVEWTAPSGSFPGGPEKSGRDAVKEGFVADVKRTYTSFGFRPETFLDVDDENSVVVIGRFEGDGVEGGKLEVPAVQVWDFKGKCATQIQIFADSTHFPDVVDEERQQELEKQRSSEERSSDEGGEGSRSQREDRSSEDGAKAKGEEGSENRSDERSEARSEVGDGSERSDGEGSQGEGAEKSGAPAER